MGKVRKWWQNFLTKLAKASQEEYGNKPPECCTPDVKEQKSPPKPAGAKK